MLCEPLSAAMDMLLIPHQAQRFAELVSLFQELPQMVSGLSSSGPLRCLTNCSGSCACVSVRCVVVGGTGLSLPLKSTLVAWCKPVSCRTLFAISAAPALKVRDLHAHYLSVVQRGNAPRFLNINGKQLPSPLWDTTQWPEACQMFPRKLVFLASKRDAAGVQQVVVNFTQRYGSDTHKAWAEAGLVPQLIEEPTKLQGGWEQVQTEYLSPVIDKEEASGWLPMQHLLHANPSVLPDHILRLLPSPEESKLLLPRAQELLSGSSQSDGGWPARCTWGRTPRQHPGFHESKEDH